MLAVTTGARASGIWCTNCHSQLSQELWRTENCRNDLIRTGDSRLNAACRSPCVDLSDVARAMVSLTGHALTLARYRGSPEADAPTLSWIPTVDHGVRSPSDPTHDGNGPPEDVERQRGNHRGNTLGGVGTTDALTAAFFPVPRLLALRVLRRDDDFSVSLLDFCTTRDCVTAAAGVRCRHGSRSASTAARYRCQQLPTAATTGWHRVNPTVRTAMQRLTWSRAATSTPTRRSTTRARPRLIRYSRGHQDITCQGCHESTHGLYPVTPTIDTTSYAQAASMQRRWLAWAAELRACHTHWMQPGSPTWVTKPHVQRSDHAGEQHSRSPVTSTGR